MMHSPWDCAQPDEWLPRSLRLCWGGGGDGGGFSGDSGGGGWSGDGGGGWGDGGFGGATTGGGDWGSAGAADFSGSFAGGDLGAWAGTAYDASSFSSGTLGGGDWGSFGTASFPDSTPGAIFTDIAGPNPGVTTGGGDWGSAGTSSFAGTGGGPGGLFSADSGVGTGGFYGSSTGGGLFGDYGTGGGFTGTGGSLYGGSGGTFGGFGTAGTASGGRSGGPLGASNMVSAAPSGGRAFADTVGGGTLTGQTSGRTSDAPTKGEAQIESAGPDVNTGRADADPDAGPEAAPEAATAPATTSEAAPGAAAGGPTTSSRADTSPSLSDAAPAGWIGGSQDAAPASAGQAAAPTQSAFGPQSVNADYQGSPYADMGPGPASFDSRFGDWGQQDAAPSQAYQAAAQTLSDLTQSALSGYDYQGSPYANMGQPDSFDSRFTGDPGQPTYQAAPDFNQAFQAFDTLSGMDLAGDRATPQGDINPNSFFAMGWDPANAYEGRGADYASGRAAQDYITSLVSAAPLGVAAPGMLSALSAMTTLSPTGLLGGTAATGGILGTLFADAGKTSPPQQLQPIDVEVVTATTPPAQETRPASDETTTTPTEAAPVAPTDAAPAAPTETAPTAPTEAAPVAPSETAPTAPPEAAPTAPPEAAPVAPPPTSQVPPSLVEQSQQAPPQAPPTQPPGLVDMAQPPALTPPAQPTTAPPQQPPPQPGEPGEPDHDEEGEPTTPAQPGRPLGAPTTRTQNTPVSTARVRQEQQGATRSRPVNEALHGILTRAAEHADVVVRVGSGGQIATRARADYRQPGGWTGSIRHNHGNAADVRLEQNGRILSFNNPQDLPIMEAFVREARRLGATGMGAGMRYMGPNTIHVGFGNPNFWRADNPGSLGLRQAWNEGRQGPANRPPADIPIRTAVIPPLPRRRPDEPQVEVAQPQPPATPPADIPAALPSPTMPLPPAEIPAPVAPVDRPPADVPVTLTPPAVAARTAQAATQFAKFLADNLSKSGKLPSNREEGQKALNALAQELAKAGYPASVAQRTILEIATQGSIKAGYGPDSNYNALGHVTRAINEMAGTAMQGYRTGKMPEAQGPPSPTAPGKRSEVPGGQQFAGLSQSRGPAPGEDYGREGDVGAASPYFNALTPTVPQLSPSIAPPPPPSRGRPPAPPPPPQYTPGGPGMFNPFRGNEAALPGGLLHLAAGGRDVGAPPAVEPGQPGQLPGRAEWESSRPGLRTGEDPSVLIEGPQATPPAPPPAFQAPSINDRGIDPDTFMMRGMEQEQNQQNLDPRGWQQASLLDILQNFNPISTAEARSGRSQAGNLQAPRADPGTIQSRLSSQRSNVIDDLQTNQGLRNTLDLIVTGEVGSQGKAAVLGFLETAMNKVAAEASREGRAPTGRDLLQYLNDRNYFSDTWGKIESGKIQGGALTDDLLDAVAGGSNTTKGSTGNSSAKSEGSRFGGNPTNVTIGREHYGVENYGHHAAWYNAMGAPEAGRGIGSDFAAQPGMPAIAITPAPTMPMRGLAKGGHVDKDEPVVVGEEGPEYFMPDRPGTVFPHMPQPGKGKNVDRWPKVPAPEYPGRYGGVEREYERQTREAQNPVPSLMDLVNSGQLRLTPNWRAMLNDPSLIALGRSRMDDRREGIDPGAEQYGAFIPAPGPAAELPDPTSPMAQALGYGSIRRRPMQIGRQSY